MANRISISSVVTTDTYGSFLVLKKSFELYHGSGYCWHIRSDAKTSRLLCQEKNIACSVIANHCADTGKSLSPRDLSLEKLNALGEAWASGDCDQVFFMNADLIFTASILEFAMEMEGDLILSPNYFPWKQIELSPYYGYFNSGFLVVRNRLFHEEWRKAISSQPWLYTDQGALNHLATQYSVGLLSQSANVGSWRSADARSFRFNLIPADCLFCRVDLFGRLASHETWIEKAYALHLLRFLIDSGLEKHRLISDKILELDESGWYSACLKLVK